MGWPGDSSRTATASSATTGVVRIASGKAIVMSSARLITGRSRLASSPGALGGVPAGGGARGPAVPHGGGERWRGGGEHVVTGDEQWSYLRRTRRARRGQQRHLGDDRGAVDAAVADQGDAGGQRRHV